MNFIRVRIAAALLLGVLTLVGCKKEPDRWSESEKKAEVAQKAKEDAPKVEVAAAGSFNKFFPADGTDGTSRVFVTDKPGFADALYKKDGAELIGLQITDKNDAPADVAAFADAPEKLGANPMKTFGKNKTQVLVNGRYQISATSKTLDHEARKAWLGKVDTAGLGKEPGASK